MLKAPGVSRFALAFFNASACTSLEASKQQQLQQKHVRKKKHEETMFQHEFFFTPKNK